MLKTGFRNLQLAIRLKQANFENPTHNLTLNYFQHLLHIHWNGFLLFIPWVSNALRMNGNCVTVVASTGLHFRAFYLLTFAASHDLKETIILIYCFLQGLRGRFPS